MAKQYFGKNRQEEELNVFSSEESLNIKEQHHKIYYAEEDQTSFSYKKSVKKETFVERISKHKITKGEKINVEDRIRNQWTMNFKYSDNQSVGGLGFVSIRAITIDPTIGHKALKEVCEDIKARIINVYLIDFNEFDETYSAPEISKKLGTHEEKALNDYRIHYEYFLNRVAHYGVI
jgi:hypothetical protein